jgi:hypothetical protein
MIEQYLSNTNESTTVRKILTFRNLNKAPLEKSAIYTKHQILLLGKVETSIAIAPNSTARFM